MASESDDSMWPRPAAARQYGTEVERVVREAKAAGWALWENEPTRILLATHREGAGGLERHEMIIGLERPFRQRARISSWRRHAVRQVAASPTADGLLEQLRGEA